MHLISAAEYDPGKGEVRLLLTNRAALILRRILEQAEDDMLAEEKHAATLKRPERDVYPLMRAERRVIIKAIYAELDRQEVAR